MSDLLALITDPLSSRIALRALLACALVAVASGLLGCVLLVRRLSLLGDAIGHAVLPGIGLAWLVAGAGIGGLLLGGMAAGIIAALAAGLAASASRLKEDAAFAAIFAICSALGVILISRAGTQADLMHILFGNLLAVDRTGLLVAAAVSVGVVTAFAAAWRPILLACFDPRAYGSAKAVQLGLLALVAATILAAMHVVGALLALGLFLLPAASAYLWCERWARMLAVSVGFALAGSLIGVLASWHLRLPPGPAVVCALGGLFLASLFAAPRHGVLARWIRARG
jgi:zinc/manganese transport system permease protein